VSKGDSGIVIPDRRYVLEVRWIATRKRTSKMR